MNLATMTVRTKRELRIYIYRRLELIFEFLAEFFDSCSESVTLCPHCGRNRYIRYTCEPCVSIAKPEDN